MTEGEDASLRESYVKHEEYFRQIVDLIPEEFYNDPESKDPSTDDETSGESVTKKKRKKDPNVDGPSTSDTFDHFVKGDGSKKNKKKKKSSREDDSESEWKTRTTKLEELREKLNKKIEELEAKRKAAKVSNSREIITLNRQRKKLSKKIQIQTSKQNKHEKGEKLGDKKSTTKTKGTGIFNKEGKMVFSKFDFKDTVMKRPKKSGSRNYHKLLEKLNKDKEKLTEMKETDPEKARELQKKVGWKTALDKAQGVKVKDNPDLLKKSMKRKEKLKKKSDKAWAERQEQLDKRMQEKQDKRKMNIQKRKQKRKDSKIQKAKKKGRMIPGF